MPLIRNDRYEVTCPADASTLAIRHLPSGTLWTLDPESRLAGSAGADAIPAGDGLAQHGAAPLSRFERGRCEREGERSLLVTLAGPAGEAVFRYELVADGVRVTLAAARSTVACATLPGAFRPDGLAAPAVVIAKNQGVWHRGTGAPFNHCLVRDGHRGFSMPFFAVAGPRQAIVAIVEEEADAAIWFARDTAGTVRASAVANPCLGRLGYDRAVLLQATPADATSIAATYRRHVQARGTFVSWDEKLESRPLLERLFGALMCFIGYCRSDETDYAAGFRTLKAMGFERAFVYPVSFGCVQQDLLMGGRPAIDIRRHLPLLDQLGYLAASWIWVEDIPADPASLMLNAEGKEILSWKIDDQRWYKSCPASQVAIADRVQDARMAGHTAQHFDVTASRAAYPCFNPAHPLDRRGDGDWRRRVLDTATRRGLVVSSEGFWGEAAGRYDIGSVKIANPVHADWHTVPLTSLVYHDSCVHDWWEIDNYNNDRFRGMDASEPFPLRGGGAPAMQAAQDALAGQPPNVFPFGTQYGWVKEVWGETFCFTCSPDQPLVGEALRAALPVAQLHARIGRHACVEHRVLAPDGSVQATRFADGTAVAANFGDSPVEVPGFGSLGPVSWKASRA